MIHSIELKKPKVSDLSFSNVFLRKLVVRLIVFCLISIIIILPAQSITKYLCEQKIENLMLKSSIELAQLADTDMAKDKKSLYANVVLSTMQEQLINNRCITDATAAFYNTTKGELIARSFEIPIILTESALEWWREQAKVENGFPTISMNAEMTDFCKNNENSTIRIDQMYYANFVLFPSKISAITDDGEIKDEFSVHVPTVTSAIYEEPTELKIVGNEESEYLYKMLVDFKFEKNDSDKENNKNAFILQYTNKDFIDSVNMQSYEFAINENDYQLDCIYQISFWHGMWLWIIVFEIIGILMCAIFAFINTKETFTMYC